MEELMEELTEKTSEELTRYSVITEKNPREIVLLRGNGCKWRRCRFCDYHFDFSLDEEANYCLNKEELMKVTGEYQKLEVINSGSFIDLDEKTMKLIEKVCLDKGIGELHFECHYMHKEKVATLREHFGKLGIKVVVKIGVESFDGLFRESYLDKGIVDEKGEPVMEPAVIAENFDECCLLFGIPGQTVETMIWEIETGLKYFKRVCVNVMVRNTKPIRPDERVIAAFVKEVYPLYIGNERVDILINNTDFGVGGKANE